MSSVATVLSDLCGPGEWMPMAKLHNEVCYANDKNLYLCNFDAVFYLMLWLVPIVFCY